MNMRCLRAFCVGLCAWVCFGLPMTPAWAAGGWLYRTPLDITHNGPEAISDIQVRLELTRANFDFARAQPDLDDLRFTDASGTRHVSHWLQSFDGERAVIWIKAPRLEPRETMRFYVYFGNPDAISLSSGFRTFDFFDDFGQAGPGYFALGEPVTIGEKDLPWETQAPHTLSVVELNRDGYRYWGYYGLADCGGIGVMRSNDLNTWQKLPEPLLNKEGERWPSAHQDGATTHLVYDRDHCGTSHVVLRASDDPLKFAAPYQTLVEPESEISNQNPHLFWNPNDKRYYLYWYRGGEKLGRWQIKVRHAPTPAGLADTASERVLLDVPYTLAAPNMLYHNGLYYLSTEVNENAWKTKIYAGTTPLGPFEPVPGEIVLSNNEACWFQHVFDGVLHGFYCKDTRGDGQGWVLQHRSGDLSAPIAERMLDKTFWTVDAGAWRFVPSQVGNGQALEGSADAVVYASIPVGAEKLAESDGQQPRVDAEKLMLTGKAGTQYDNVRIRKRTDLPPAAKFGVQQLRSGVGVTWLPNEADRPSQKIPSLDGLFWLIGPVVLTGFALLIASKSAKKQL